MAERKRRKDFIDLTGQKFGRLTVIGIADPETKGEHKWVCRCSCPEHNIVCVRGINLRSGNTRSCGCLAHETCVKRGYDSAKHGMTDTHIHNVWDCMKDRCFNPKKDGFQRYGGRGISVCDEWLGEHGFENFYQWAVTHGYDETLQIDRIDNDGNYCPENCRWVPAKINMRNRSVNHFIETPWGRMTIAEYVERIDGDYNLVYAQIMKGRHDINWITEHYKHQQSRYRRKKDGIQEAKG